MSHREIFYLHLTMMRARRTRGIQRAFRETSWNEFPHARR